MGTLESTDSGEDFHSSPTCDTTMSTLIQSIVYYLRLIYFSLLCLPRDARLIYRTLRFVSALKWSEWKNFTAGKYLERAVSQAPDKVCFYYEDEQWTFRQVNDLSNRVANYFAARGLKKGDSVALLMDNRPVYPCIWLGLSKIGVITALINFNLRSKSLAHCVKVANAKRVIYGKGFSAAIQQVLDEGELADVEFYSFDDESDGQPELARAIKMQKDLKSASAEPPVLQKGQESGYLDILSYVYTSGTTGLPKAAVIKHYRFLYASFGAIYINGCRADDILLVPLPLYHMAGGMLAVGQAITFTTSVVILKKFSASRFWTDCIRYKATVAQYLGELCRFLLSQPEKPEETQHCLRMFMGNGLRAEMWEEFVSRFKIPMVVEFYGATEGNCGLSNMLGKPGAIGFLPRPLLPILKQRLIKVDEYTGEPLRDPESGLCIVCKPHELGEMVSTIKTGNPIKDFPGYTDKSSTNKKILQDVFVQGDACFRAGDVMIMDDYGYFYFRDRIGDTYRWKGENVSTMEVEAVISNFIGMKDVAVYGVQVANTDGRAGMAAIPDPEGKVDLNNLATALTKALPPYAIPVFIRILDKDIELTGTYKLRKVDLQKDGVDLNVIKDKVYVFSKGQYSPLTKDIYSKIAAGQYRL